MRVDDAGLEAPRSTGKALVGAMLGVYWRYRLGDYRIICDIQDGALCFLVVELATVGKRLQLPDRFAPRADLGGGVFPLSEYATAENAENAASYGYEDALTEASAWLASQLE